MLTDQPSDALTVAALMQRTTLSRKSFYVYFKDRADLLTSLVEPLRRDADAALATWRDAPDMVLAGRTALHAAALMYRRHSPVLRALATASDRDGETAAVWRAFIDPLVAIAVQKITEATADGRSHGLDPVPVARALVAMNVASLLTLHPGSPVHHAEELAQTLATIWERTIFSGVAVTNAD